MLESGSMKPCDVIALSASRGFTADLLQNEVKSITGVI